MALPARDAIQRSIRMGSGQHDGTRRLERWMARRRPAAGARTGAARDGAVTRRQVLALTSVLLIAAVGAAGATGQIAVAFDINRFALLRYAAYTLLGLVAVHVALAWPGLVAVVRRWSRSGRRPHAAQPPAQGSTGASVEPRPGTPAGARASGQALSASRGRAAVPLARALERRWGRGSAGSACRRS